MLPTYDAKAIAEAMGLAFAQTGVSSAVKSRQARLSASPSAILIERAVENGLPRRA